jgi:hypothetical protein
MDDRSLGGRDVVQGEEQEFSLLPDLFTGGRDTQSLQDRSFAHRKPRGFIASDPVMVRENDCVDRISDFCWKTALVQCRVLAQFGKSRSLIQLRSDPQTFVHVSAGLFGWKDVLTSRA